MSGNINVLWMHSTCFLTMTDFLVLLGYKNPLELTSSASFSSFVEDLKVGHYDLTSEEELWIQTFQR